MPSVHAGDLDVYYRENGAQGEHGAIVFVHGNWATSSWWEPVLARLPAPLWRGIAYDVRGRGRTTGPDSDYSIPSLAADLGSLIEALGLETPHLVGHSLGSAIVMQYALDHPAKVRSLTVVAPAWVDGMPNHPPDTLDWKGSGSCKTTRRRSLTPCPCCARPCLPEVSGSASLSRATDSGGKLRKATSKRWPSGSRASY